MEEVVDDVQLAGAGHLVVDVLADGEVEHARGRTARTPPAGRPAPSTRPAITSSSVPCRKSRLPVSCSARCGEVSAFRQCSTSSTMLVDAEQDLRREVAQRHVQHQRVVLEPRRVVTCGCAGDGGEDHQVAGADQLLRAVVHGDPAAGARPAPGSRGSRPRCRRTGRARRSRRTTSRCRRGRCGCSGRSARCRRTRPGSGGRRPRLSQSAASAADAAVRVALMIELSRQANG